MIDAVAVVARLREVDARSGARRVAWSETWRAERERQDATVRALVPGALVETDAFANRWYVLPGAERETVLLGGHSDCVPGGGWLDGILGVHAGIGALAAAGTRPARTVAVVDWADEEGTRFGRSLLGSSAAVGRLTLDELRGMDGAIEVVTSYGFEPSMLGTPTPRLADVVAAVELHIEQGPILEQEARSVAAVSGCLGVRRFRCTVEGAAGHAGATPMTDRRDPVRAAAQAIAGIADLAESTGGLATVGVLEGEPALPTAIPARCTFTLDLRHGDAGALAALEAVALARLDAAVHACGCSSTPVLLWSIEPVRFDEELTARAAVRSGGGSPLVSGPLHDSASLAQAGVPATMLFAPSIAGISHARAEDTAERDLIDALKCFGALVAELTCIGAPTT